MNKHTYNNKELTKLLVMVNPEINGRRVHELTDIPLTSAQSNVSVARRELGIERG